MDEKTNSVHAQQTVPAWKRLVEQQVELLGTVGEQVGKLNHQNIEQATNTMDELGRMAKESMNYASQLATAQSNLEAWKKLMHEQVDRSCSAAEVLHGIDDSHADQARKMMDDVTEMSKATLTYTTQLSDEWRRIAVENTRRAAELFTPRS